MKTLFYPRLAWDGLRKNRRMVFPYLLTCICMIAIFYILSFLSTPKTIALLPRGGDIAHFVMILGSIVIAFFSLLFLYYTNSFLIRRRAAEFGLYNVLGMNKGNLAKIITFESLITSGIAVVFGLAVGIALSKLAELGLIKMVGGTVNYSVRVEMRCVAYTVIFYLAIFALLWISSVIRVGRSSAVTLLKSEKAGEKPPKANWFFGILGVAILGTAYYIAVSIVNPVEALLRFFVAVIMVIVATYLLMIAGSVLLCRILQKNKKYYYDPRHFVSVSSMVYRMKRNGAGLASIAIISTMVLVMIASASCLMFGTKEMIENRFQGDINYTVRFYDSSLLNEKSMDAMKGIIKDYGQSHNFDIEPVFDMYYVEMSGMIEGNRLYFDITDEDLSSMSKLRYVYLIPLSLYNRQTGSDLTLDSGEAVAFVSNAGMSHDSVDLIIGDKIKTYRLLRSDEKNFDVGNYLEKMVPAIKLIVPDISEAASALGVSADDSFSPMMFTWKYCFDTGQTSMSMMDCANDIRKAVNDIMDAEPEMAGKYIILSEEKETEGLDFISAAGSLFFIGILLSIAFVLAAVLIIYYKQISEGYEDSRRFEVMRKVGMTGEDIRKNINSQLLVVFFIPLLFAGVHLAFAFPMIGKLLMLFGVYNPGLFMLTTLISFATFAVFYIAVYKVTSNVYYNIVMDSWGRG